MAELPLLTLSKHVNLQEIYLTRKIITIAVKYYFCFDCHAVKVSYVLMVYF